jgi:hypothetical protein
LAELCWILAWHGTSLSSRPELNREPGNNLWGRSGRQPELQQTRRA